MPLEMLEIILHQKIIIFAVENFSIGLNTQIRLIQRLLYKYKHTILAYF